MTNIIGRNGTNFPAAPVIRSITLPSLDGLLGEFWFGVDQATSVKNRAFGGSDMVPIASAGGGASAYAAAYATVKNDATLGASYGFDTGVVAPNAVTFCALHRQQALVAGATKARVFGSDNTGIGANGASNGYFSFANGFLDGSTDQAHVIYPSASTDFFFVVGTGIIGQVGNITVFEAGSPVTDAATRTDTTRGATTVKVGGFIDNQHQGQVDLAWAAYFNTIKSTQQILDMYASVKAWAITRGLTVN